MLVLVLGGLYAVYIHIRMWFDGDTVGYSPPKSNRTKAFREEYHIPKAQPNNYSGIKRQTLFSNGPLKVTRTYNPRVGYTNTRSMNTPTGLTVFKNGKIIRKQKWRKPRE